MKSLILPIEMCFGFEMCLKHVCTLYILHEMCLLFEMCLKHVCTLFILHEMCCWFEMCLKHVLSGALCLCLRSVAMIVCKDLRCLVLYHTLIFLYCFLMLWFRLRGWPLFQCILCWQVSNSFQDLKAALVGFQHEDRSIGFGTRR